MVRFARYGYCHRTQTQSTEQNFILIRNIHFFPGKSRATRRALFVTLSLVTLGTFQGFTVLQVYAQPLFEKAVPDWSSTVCSIVLALITLGAALMSGTLSDLSGRRVRVFVYKI